MIDTRSDIGLNNRICVIGVYFGTLPAYFPLWLRSCELNPTVDFLLFGDQLPQDVPENVKCHPMTLEKMRGLAREALQLEVCLDRPYKCCDFKGVYGLIFREQAADYEYWGCCDFDLIFGDLQGMFDRYELYRYDRFFGLGHLSLFRNTEEVNRRYLCSGGSVDYITAFTGSKGTAFDEFPGLTAIYRENGFPIFLKRIFADIAMVYHRYRVVEVYPYDEVPKNYREQVLYWEDGKVYRAYYEGGEIRTEEYIYVHFKKRPNYPVDFDAGSVKAFYITNQGFVLKDGPVTREAMQKLNPYPGRMFEMREKLRFDWQHLLGKIKIRLGRNR